VSEDEVLAILRGLELHVIRTESMCADILTVMRGLVDLWREQVENPSASVTVYEADSVPDLRTFDMKVLGMLEEMQQTIRVLTSEVNRLSDRQDYSDRIIHKYINNGDGKC